jgi:hypothetical protein
MITTIEMTMLRRLPKPRRAGGCTAGAGAVSGTLVVLTLPSSPKAHLFDEPLLSPVGPEGPTLIDRVTSPKPIESEDADMAREHMPAGLT